VLAAVLCRAPLLVWALRRSACTCNLPAAFGTALVMPRAWAYTGTPKAEVRDNREPRRYTRGNDNTTLDSAATARTRNRYAPGLHTSND